MRFVQAAVVLREAQIGQTAELRVADCPGGESGRSQSEPQRSQYLSSRRAPVGCSLSAVFSGGNVPPFLIAKKKPCMSAVRTERVAIRRPAKSETQERFALHAGLASVAMTCWGYLVLLARAKAPANANSFHRTKVRCSYLVPTLSLEKRER